ncbi:MAG: 16S rRNA (cytosine(1402)-N(4))-methyltransferase RsmH [Bacteroidales bacterium]
MSTYHIPALLSESINALDIKADGVYVDVTFGGGGHSSEILKKLKNGKLIAFDQDEEALENAFEDKRLTLVHSNFRYVKNFLKYYKIDKVDGIIADLGISFNQVDKVARGFSFKTGVDLDMRMNSRAKVSAAEILNSYDENRLTSIIREFGELHNANLISKTIVENRVGQRIDKSDQLIKMLIKYAPKNAENKFFAKVFQALRIEVNNEMDALKEFLVSCEEIIAKGGRLVVISYHSLEDRLVKNYMKAGNFTGETEKDVYGKFSVPFSVVNKKPLVPDMQEIQINPRSRSAKLRIAEKN